MKQEENQKTQYISSLPLVRFRYVAYGRLHSGSRVVVRGHVYAREEMYYQAQARALESIQKEIPSFEPDAENFISVKMHKTLRKTYGFY